MSKETRNGVDNHFRNLMLSAVIGGAIGFVGAGGLDSQKPDENTEVHKEKIEEAILAAPIGGGIGFTSYYLGLIGLAGVDTIKKRRNNNTDLQK